MNKRLNVKRQFYQQEHNAIKWINSIFVKLTLYSISIIISILLIVTIVTSTIVNVQMKEQFINSSKSMLDQNKNHIELIVGLIENYAVQIYSSPTIQKQLGMEYDDSFERSQAIQQITDRIRDVLGSSEIISSIQIVSKTGMNIGLPNIKANMNYDFIVKQNYYDEIVSLEGRGFWTKPYLDNVRRDDLETFFVSNIRVLKEMSINEEIGVLIFNISIEDLQQIITNNEKDDNDLLNGYNYIVDDEGYIIVHPIESFIGKNVNNMGDLKKIMKQDEDYFTYLDKNKKEWFTVFTISKVNNWKYVSEIPASELTAGADQIKQAIIIISIICLLITIILTMTLSSKITKPLKHMILEMDKVKRDNMK